MKLLAILLCSMCLNSLPFDEKIWNKCWNEEESYFDFTKSAWENLSNNTKLEYVKKYQTWYAKKVGKEVEKDFLDGGISIRMVLIPAGKFWMGSASSEKSRDSDEKKHKVLISKEYWLGKYEITQKQWYDVTGEKLWSDKNYMKENKNHAATHISREDIESKFLSKLRGDYNFPAEAQWEYSCRSGINSKFYWGENEKEINNYGHSMKSNKFKYIAPVGSFKENGFGLHDMSGNVYEWCRDNYGSYNTKEVKDPIFIDEGFNYVVRGGSWGNFWLKRFRSADRSFRKASNRSGFVGFRIFKP